MEDREELLLSREVRRGEKYSNQADLCQPVANAPKKWTADRCRCGNHATSLSDQEDKPGNGADAAFGGNIENISESFNYARNNTETRSILPMTRCSFRNQHAQPFDIHHVVEPSKRDCLPGGTS